MNATSEVSGLSRSPSCVLMVFSQVLAFFIIVGNSLVITTYRRNAFLHTRSNIFIVSLVVSDLLVGAVSVPIWTYLTFVNFQNIPIHLLEIYLCFDIFSALASIFHFTAIAIERCYVISRPFTYVNDSSVQNIYIYHTAWMVAVVMVALSQMQTSITLKRAYTVFVFTVSFVYTKIFRTASSLVRRTPAWTRQKPLRAKFVRSEKLL